jgi:hypothetical protein
VARPKPRLIAETDLYPPEHPVELACAADREYFAAHPHEKSRVRARIPGEFGLIESELDDQFQWVLVTQLKPGERSRQPLAIFAPPVSPNVLEEVQKEIDE